MRADPHLCCGDRCHPAQLARAQNTYGFYVCHELGTGQIWCVSHGFCLGLPPGVKARAQTCISQRQNLGCHQTGILGTGRPIASVPTGTPPGICTIDSSESIPFRAFDSTGTPKTGRQV